MRNYLAPSSLAFLALTVVLGGASSQGILGNALLQFLAVILILWVLLFDQPKSASDEEGLRIRWVVGAATLLVFAQFIPLPPILWSHLPGREVLTRGFDLLGMSLPWQTLSMSSWSTLASLTWCLPAIAMFMAARSPRGPSFSAVAAMIAALASISIALGIEQIVSGSWYPYATTNYGAPVGFFSNGNHQASFIVCALVLWAGYSGAVVNLGPGKRFSNGKLVLFYGLCIFFAIGVILCGSLAGWALLAIALGGAVLIVNPTSRPRPAVLVALLALSFTALLAFVIVASSTTDLLIDTTQPGMSRIDFWKNGIKMVANYFPIGSGLGTFEELYHLLENPQIVDSTYVNHAHNDYLELIIEAGIPGLLVIASFFVWFVQRSVVVLRSEFSPGAYACVFVIVVIALHSAVDYPLRTAAMSSIFALAVGFLARRSDAEQQSARRRQSRPVYPR